MFWRQRTRLAASKSIIFKTMKPNHVKSYSIETKLAFEYGCANFEVVCKPGVFHVDRTKYIPLLEDAGDVLTFVRPEGFGKSTIVSMLDYYYNILYESRFDELFGHLEIGKNPTEKRNAFLVFRISFSSLDTRNCDTLRRSLDNTINGAVAAFKWAYEPVFGTSIEEIKVNATNAISSFASLANFVAKSKFRSKVTSNSFT